MAARTMLQFDYEQAHGREVTAVLGISAGSASWQGIAIVTGASAVLLHVDLETDELIVDFGPASALTARWKPVDVLAAAVGSKLGWCWVGRNYLGYLDMFTVSFSGLHPQFCFVSAASNITISGLAWANQVHGGSPEPIKS